MIINRVWSMPSSQTFTIKPIRELLTRYIKNPEKWIDPFAGYNSPAYWSNDLDESAKTLYHTEASVFCRHLLYQLKMVESFEWGLFDPPYSARQITEHYKAVGHQADMVDTSNTFYSRVLVYMAKLIKSGGYLIHCGWNSNGYGKSNGFEIVEILLVAHGGQHHDTIVTVEIKI